MENLKILALGRNQIKKIENLDSVAETLEELWISYNLLERLVSFAMPGECICEAALTHFCLALCVDRTLCSVRDCRAVA